MDKREGHWIRPLKRVKIPTRCIFFDTETKTTDSDGTQEMILAVAVFCRYQQDRVTNKPIWFKTTSPDDLFSFICSQTSITKSVRVLSANVWFDMRVSGLLDRLKEHKWKCRFVYISGKIFFARFFKAKLEIEFINIQNYFNNSVAQIGKSIGMPKLEIDFATHDPKLLYDYCKRDVEIIYMAYTDLVKYIVKNKIGSIGYTLTSTAYSIYRKTFMTQWLHVHDNEEATDLERKTYYGGRCECFHIGKFHNGPYYKVDVNGMYSFVMANKEYPYHLCKIGTNVKPALLEKIRHRYLYAAHVTINTDEAAYPHRINKKLTFPIGTFETYLTTGLLDYALKHNHLKAVHKVALYDKAFIFEKYVDFFYAERLRYQKQKNETFAYVCKIMLNSLYGKFGQHVPELIYEIETDSKTNSRELIYDVDEESYYVKQCFFGLEQMFKMRMIETANSIPVISAHVTDYARMYLWELCKQAGLKHLYYVDTDSLIVDQTGFNNLNESLHDNEIGKLKIEGKSKEIDIIGLKNYIFDGVHKLKGIPINHVKLAKDVYEYKMFPGIVSELREGLAKQYKIKTVQKKISPIYDKGVVQQNGTVLPYVLR